MNIKRFIKLSITIVHDDIKSNSKAIVGFITLRTSSLISENGDKTTGHSAIEIAKIAINKPYERQGYGTILHL